MVTLAREFGPIGSQALLANLVQHVLAYRGLLYRCPEFRDAVYAEGIFPCPAAVVKSRGKATLVRTFQNGRGIMGRKSPVEKQSRRAFSYA